MSPKTREADEIRAYWRMRLAADQKDVYDAVLERSKGVLAVKETAKHGRRVYELPPDPIAFRALAEQALGKPRETMDLTSQGEKLRVVMPQEIVCKNITKKDQQ
ncbi:hypothetical protein GF380_05765 [Candidatus Uhrbacteria bacterium]|nr:hypothetical protein [Candidatus Uhrbacteria bacterium]